MESQVERENGKWSGYEGDRVCATEEVSRETVEEVNRSCDYRPVKHHQLFGYTDYTTRLKLIRDIHYP